jgi:hypothetical protein
MIYRSKESTRQELPKPMSSAFNRSHQSPHPDSLSSLRTVVMYIKGYFKPTATPFEQKV